jgi:hypothetical protein
MRWNALLASVFALVSLLFGSIDAAAAVCGALPNTLTNGTTADATQVMANFNTLLNCINNLPPPNPNLLVNPSMEIDQVNEGASVSLTSGTAAYCVDGWQALYNSSATGVTCQRVSDGPGTFPNSVKITVGTGASVGAGNYLILRQPVEANQITAAALGNSGATGLCVGFQVKSSIGSYTFSGAITNFAGNRSYPFNVVVSSASTWTPVSVCLTGDTAGTWVTSGAAGGAYLIITAAAGSTFQGTVNTWAAGNFYGTNSTTTTMLSTNGANFQITEAKWEISQASPTTAAVATPFVRRDFTAELDLAHRYYAKTFPQGTPPAQNAGLPGALCAVSASTTAGALGASWRLPAELRASPTITTYNPSVANANWRDVTDSTDAIVNVGPPLAQATTGLNFRELTTALVVGSTYCIHATADARL